MNINCACAPAASVIGHCDVAPWNIVARDGRAAALIDWDRAGPVDPLTELAQACWLNAKLHDDVVAVREGLPSVEVRARHLRAIVDGYGLAAADRRGFVDRIVEFTVHDAADEADLAQITADTTPDQLEPRVPWALAWRTRASIRCPRDTMTAPSDLNPVEAAMNIAWLED
jgi:aminoglycoside phosphotransferase (APT) family kinase protein